MGKLREFLYRCGAMERPLTLESLEANQDARDCLESFMNSDLGKTQGLVIVSIDDGGDVSVHTSSDLGSLEILGVLDVAKNLVLNGKECE